MKKKIIVIGSGFGGLGAAIRLAAKGHDVEIFEKRDKPGGRAYVYEVNGFKFDGGPTVVTAPFLFDELFALAGKKKEDYFTLKRSTHSTEYLTTKKNSSIITLIQILP